MKKNASNETSQNSLQQTFWRWFSLSVLALMLAAAWPARSADVFIDEGDGDFAATPVSSPAAAPLAAAVAPAPVQAGPAPASEDSPIANPGTELDSQIGQLEPATAPGGTDPMAAPTEAQPMDPVAEAPVETPKKASVKKSSKKKDAKAKKSKSKKASKAKKSKAKKKDKKASGKKKKKSSVSAATKSASKRKVASISKFAGGQYATTSRDCAMESAPGAGDAVGTSKASRKLWVEESGNTSYYKVYGKSGTAAFLPRDCF